MSNKLLPKNVVVLAPNNLGRMVRKQGADFGSQLAEGVLAIVNPHPNIGGRIF